MEALCLYLFCYALLCILSSFAIILKRKRKLVAFLLLSYRCVVTMNALWLFFTVSCVGLQCVITWPYSLFGWCFSFFLHLSICICVTVSSSEPVGWLWIKLTWTHWEWGPVSEVVFNLIFKVTSANKKNHFNQQKGLSTCYLLNQVTDTKQPFHIKSFWQNKGLIWLYWHWNYNHVTSRLAKR